MICHDNDSFVSSHRVSTSPNAAIYLMLEAAAAVRLLNILPLFRPP